MAELWKPLFKSHFCPELKICSQELSNLLLVLNCVLTRFLNFIRSDWLFFCILILLDALMGSVALKDRIEIF